MHIRIMVPEFFKLIHDCTCIDLLKGVRPLFLWLSENDVFTRPTLLSVLTLKKVLNPEFTSNESNMLYERYGLLEPHLPTYLFSKIITMKEKVQLDWVPCIVSHITYHFDSDVSPIPFSSKEGLWLPFMRFSFSSYVVRLT